jgi:hypothetical protein
MDTSSLINAPKNTGTDIINKDFIKRFINDHPQYDMDCFDFKRILKLANRELQKSIMDDKDGVKLPQDLGIIYVAAYRSKNKNFNMADSSKYGKSLYFMNLHTNGWVCTIQYNTQYVKLKKMWKRLWKFKGERHFTRAVSKRFREDWMNYHKISPKVIKKDNTTDND